MSEHDEKVNRQRLLLKAEAWAKIPKCIHIHKLSSMWYDNRPQDTKNEHVTDIQYNSGLIVRMRKGKVIHKFGEAKTGQDLLDLYYRGE
tara:strand:+ start:5762 stop:6028 length:267 start_codon:yes stop_codon:yes gene_type:complete